MILNIEHVKRWIIHSPRNDWIVACNIACDLHNEFPFAAANQKRSTMPDIEIECSSRYDILALTKLGRLGM